MQGRTKDIVSDWDVGIDNLHETILTTDANGYITKWNKGAERLFGYTAEEAIGRHAEICYERGLEAMEREIIAPLKRDGRLDFIGKMINKSGEVFDGHTLGSLITAPDGKVTGMVGYMRDITKRKRVDDVFRRYQQIISVSPDMMSLVGPDYIYLAVNDAYVKALGRPKEEIIGHHVSEFVGQDGFEQAVKPKLDASLAGISGRLEGWFDYPDHGQRYMDIVYEPVRNDGDAIIGVAVSIRDLTDRRRVEDDLAKQTELLQRAEKLAHVGHFRRPLVDGNIYWSDEMYRIFGVDRETVVLTRDSVLASLHPDDAERYVKQLDAATARGGSVEVDFRGVRPDGEIRHIHAEVETELSNTGVTVAIFGAVKDVTEIFAAEAKLRQREAELSSITRLSPTGIFRVDRSGRATFINERWYETMGFAPDSDAGARWHRAIHPDDRDVAIKICKDSIAQCVPFAAEFRVIRPDRSVAWTYSEATPERDPNGEVTGFVGFTLDITERKAAEAQLLAARTLAESGERIRLAFENISSGSLVISAKGIIEIFNSAAGKIFGYTAEQVVGQNVEMLMPVPVRNKHEGYIRDYLETGEAKVVGIGREVVGLRKNGEEFPMHINVGVLTLGDEVSFIGSITDLTGTKSLEEQVRRSQRLEAVGQLTGGVAHDFNNLLAIMIGNAELLESLIGEDEEVKKPVKAIIAAVDRGASLTQRLLAFSRRQTLSPVANDVSDLIVGLEDMLRRTLGETVDLRIEDMPDLWPATIDPHQFENALVNLAINARDAMPDGGTLSIEAANVTLDEAFVMQLDEVTPGDYVKVAVSDTGSGMPPEVLEKVFEPFFTTKEVGEGSGLGLSMVYGFAKQSGGHITIYSEVDQGTTVSLYLPRSEDPIVQDDIKDETAEFEQRSERILVVEDDEDVRNVAVYLLRDQGYEIVDAKDGVEAVNHLTKGKAFDLLFTDVVLPGGMNGVKIAEQAKRLQPNIKVIYTTGYAENAFVHNGPLDPGITVVNKPYRRAELLEKVRAILDSEEV